MKIRWPLIIMFFVGLVMVVYPSYLIMDTHSKITSPVTIQPVYVEEVTPVVSTPEPTIEPTVEPTPTATLIPTTTPIIAPTPTPFPKPDFCKNNDNYIIKVLGQYRLSTSENFELWSCLDCVPLQDASQVEAFMAWDTIDTVKFNWASWTCGHYAQHINHVATENSIICMVVAIRFDGFSHSIVAFPTTDDGIVYVDPMTDSWVTLKVGEPYITSPMNHKSGSGITWDKIITRFELLY